MTKVLEIISVAFFFATCIIMLIIGAFSLTRFKAVLWQRIILYGIGGAYVLCGGLIYHSFLETNPLLTYILSILLSSAVITAVIFLIKQVRKLINQPEIEKCTQPTAPQKKKFRKTKFWIILAIVLILLIGVLVFDFITTKNRTIEDINGSDTALAVLTNEDILLDDHTWIGSSCNEGLYGKHTNVSTDHIRTDYDKSSFHCEKFSGIKTMQTTNIGTDILTLNIESILEYGNMEIFIIVDDTIYEEVPVGQAYTTTLTGIAGKNIIVRYGAESAKIDITVTREYEGVTNDFSKNHAKD